jgi:hypothetical protein
MQTKCSLVCGLNTINKPDYQKQLTQLVSQSLHPLLTFFEKEENLAPLILLMQEGQLVPSQAD